MKITVSLPLDQACELLAKHPDIVDFFPEGAKIEFLPSADGDSGQITRLTAEVVL